MTTQRSSRPRSMSNAHGGAAKSRKCAVLVAGLALAVAGCTGNADDESPPQPPPSFSEQKTPDPAPPPPRPAPVEQETLADNCGLNPADMDDATKAQCGLVPEGRATEETVPECTGNTSLVPASPIGPYCDHSEGVGEGGTSIPEGTPPLPEDFSGYTCDLSSPPAFENPAAPNEITNRACGYTDEYGTEHNADPWVEDQLRFGCEQGYITEGC